jgi:serine protease Do
MTKFQAILLLALLTGCANPYAKFYEDLTKTWPRERQLRLLAPTNQPELRAAAPPRHEDEFRQLAERNYVPIGLAQFQGGKPTRKNLLAQAHKVGADVVVYSSYLSHTEKGVERVSTYQPGQTYTTTTYGTANASAYGSGYNAFGYGNYSGYTTTTSSGTVRTDFVPYERQVYSHNALFWRRVKPGIFGASFKPIPETLRNALQRNTGAYIFVITQESPAFFANFLSGDLLIQIADDPVTNPEKCLAILKKHAGKKVVIKIIRNNSERKIEVQLNPEG